MLLFRCAQDAEPARKLPTRTLPLIFDSGIASIRPASVGVNQRNSVGEMRYAMTPVTMPLTRCGQWKRHAPCQVACSLAAAARSNPSRGR